MYKVLWIDDQHEDGEMVQFAIEADNEGLHLESYASFEEGFYALENDIERFDAILLDGLFFERKDQKVGTENEVGLGMAIAKINELKSKKVFPWFVLSGKSSFTEKENSILKANKKRCFDKTNPSDVVELFKHIKKDAGEQEDAQLKHKYKSILEVCEEKYLGKEYFSRVFALVKHIEETGFIAQTEDMLNPLRKIVEAIFHRLGEKAIIPIEILKNKGWLNGSSRFLSNKHGDYTHKREFIPPLIGENFHRLLVILQDGSHAEGNLKLQVDKFLKTSGNDYLYKSNILLLFHILLWFKSHIDDYEDIETNKSFWKKNNDKEEWVYGSVIRIAENGWGTFKSNTSGEEIGILPNIVSEKGLATSDKVKVKTKPSPDGSKKYLKEIKKDI